MILSRQLPAGCRLASSRDLARELSVSRNTVLLAYEQLLAEGYAVGVVGSGTFVASELPARTEAAAGVPNARTWEQAEANLSNFARRASYMPYHVAGPREHAFRFDFKYGIPAVRDFPFEIWRKLLSKQARSSAPEAFMYGPPEGNHDLRAAIADYLRRSRGIVCDPDRIMVVNGSQQALDLTARALLDPGDAVVIEDPSYPGARDVYLAAGAQLIPAAVDDNGLNIETLPPAAARSRLAYVTPSHQFPTGAVMSLARRLALLSWARETGAYIVEDDYDSEFRYDSRPIEAVQALEPDGPVIYVGTLSKTLSPSLRLGYLVAPQQLIQPLRALKFLTDRHTSSLQQNVLKDFIEQGHFERHLRRSKRSNAGRRAALISALGKNFGDSVSVDGGNAGLHLVVWFKDVPCERTERLVELAEKQRVGVYSVAPYYIDPPKQAGLLLGYAALEEADIRRGVALLAQALRCEAGCVGR
jgi:GntR family transcriptional regulator/MocR family aminotransferase